ncbi:FadR family transcriptional regulator [Flavobacteriaceae bacterium TP-CH-4]|uniref:FadR family transcriptional regulator n=1 Tax=Pelagihabitans pacificus TaxID=2696054 RepID=A0A967E7C1_9FLAO|nr:FadR/GntR family transcriptional regulator [Pelagihabitans pacificus]NHF60094.1 FadR family transcriptional regulator [Pelagihabitans pacificus]
MNDLQLSPVAVTKPADSIIMQLRDLINKGTLKPGDKLPPERELAEQLAVGRGHVREALKKLEFYGILQTRPQSGTTVAHLGIRLLDGLIANVIQLEKNDFEALIETRGIMESGAAFLAAQRATREDIRQLEQILDRYKQGALNGNPAMDEDMLFHLKIAELSGNRVLQSLISLIAPEVHQLSSQKGTCTPKRLKAAVKEHGEILKAIQTGDASKASEAMRNHMKNTLA